MPSQPKVAVYARVSTDEQSPDAQLRDLRKYVQSRGWEQVVEFADVGAIGPENSLPGWNQLWQTICRGGIQVLVVPAINRIGRSMPHLKRVLSTISEQNVTLISLRESTELCAPPLEAGYWQTSHRPG